MPITNQVSSWGRYPYYPQQAHPIYWREEVASVLSDITAKTGSGVLAYGCGRSYGDSCLAQSNQVLAMTGMGRLLAADWQKGLILAEAGMTLAELIRIALPRGWFLPVTPGTKFVTLGGAVANDVHGKNHHRMGTIGRHIGRLLLHRSDEGLVECSIEQRPELFAATVGGLGLTGIILAVELQLRPIVSSKIEQTTIRFNSLDEFFDLSNIYDKNREYTVAWLDCLPDDKQAARGHFIAGEHAQSGKLEIDKSKNYFMPFVPPFSLINSFTSRMGNKLYYHRQLKKEKNQSISYNRFFYPLDNLLEWNRLYGRKGFQQYQCVVPKQNAKKTIGTMIKAIKDKKASSFLAVLKTYGDLKSPGLLSFPLAGVSLALDFPQNFVNHSLFEYLDDLVHEAGGRLYPAKDAHMSAVHFQQAYPHWEELEKLRDPSLLSKFWQRVTQ